MIINPIYEYPSVDRVTLENGNRYYVCPDSGKRLASVTTILSNTSTKDFSEWENRVGKVTAARERKYGTDLGSLVHDHLEKHILNEDRPGGNNLIRVEAKRMSDVVIEKGLPDIEEIWGIETPLYLPELFAGTTDVVGIYRGKQSVIDFKTAKKIRKRDEIEDYQDQISAYALCHNEKYGTDIEQGVIFMVARDLNFEVFTYDRDAIETGKSNFLNRVESFYETFEGFD